MIETSACIQTMVLSFFKILYSCTNNMSGPKEEGIFYDIQELGSFRRKVEELNEALAVGRKEAILLLNNPSSFLPSGK